MPAGSGSGGGKDDECMPDDWLNDLKDWVREFPCVIVRLEQEEWDHLADSRRGLGEFAMARSLLSFPSVIGAVVGRRSVHG